MVLEGEVMSINRNYYVIAGYDLTKFITSKYDDWKWTEEGEKFTCNQSEGYIQLFDDPMNSSHLYLGYVLGNGDEYEFETTKINLNEVSRQEKYVLNKLRQIIDIGIVKNVFESQDLKYEIIVFEECS